MWKFTKADAQTPPDDAVLSLVLRLANRLALTPPERARLAALIALHEDAGAKRSGPVTLRKAGARAYCSM
jgi:hypothetical protein